MATPEKGPIYCIEDYDGLREFLGMVMVEELKIPRERVVMIASRREAERLLEEAEQTGRSPDLVLLNLNLAGESGLPILERIRKSPSEKLSCTPVIAMSTDESRREEVIERGANAFLSKPYPVLEELEDTISFFLGTLDQAKAA